MFQRVPSAAVGKIDINNFNVAPGNSRIDTAAFVPFDDRHVENGTDTLHRLIEYDAVMLQRRRLCDRRRKSGSQNNGEDKTLGR